MRRLRHRQAHLPPRAEERCPPAVTGHEIVGLVDEIGEDVASVELGAKVVVATPVGCGECIYCQREQYNLCESFTALGYDYQPAGSPNT